MEGAPQDFVNLVSSYLHWQDARMICDNVGLFNKAYSDKLFTTDITKASLTSQTIGLQDLVSSLYSSYAIIERTDDEAFTDTEIIPNPTTRQIISIVDDWIRRVQGLDKSSDYSRPPRLSADTNTKLTLLSIGMRYDFPCRWNIFIISNEDNIREIGNYLCDLHAENIDIDVRYLRYFIGL
jgi:hypothetical protein